MPMKPVLLTLAVCFSLAFLLPAPAAAASAPDRPGAPAVQGDATRGAACAAVPKEMTAEARKVHEPFIRQAYDLAISAAKKGNHPFGALLVHRGQVILTAENTTVTDKDPIRHAEINLLVKASRELSPEVVRESTLYASASPCMICCATMWYRGVGKVVYGISHEAFGKATGFANGMACSQLYRENGKALEWIGPVLEEEGLKAFGKH